MNTESDLFVVAVMAIIIKDRKMLTMKRSMKKKAAPGLWEVLSGRLQQSEQPRVGLLREIKEESGLDVELSETPFDVYKTKYLDRPMLALVYEAHVVSGEVSLSDEHSEYSWVTLKEFEEKTTLKRLLCAAQKLSHLIDQ